MTRSIGRVARFRVVYTEGEPREYEADECRTQQGQFVFVTRHGPASWPDQGIGMFTIPAEGVERVERIDPDERDRSD